MTVDSPRITVETIMNPKLIPCLALVLSVLIPHPNSVHAEDRIWVDGKINGQPVRLAFDTGASGPALFIPKNK